MGQRMPTEGAAKEPSVEQGSLSGKHQPEASSKGTEYAQETLNDEGPEVDVRKVHECIIFRLKTERAAFLEKFKALIKQEDNREELTKDDADLINLAFEPQDTGRTILHRLITLVSEKDADLRPEVAIEFIKMIVSLEPALILLRGDLDSKLNALELAGSLQNCLGIIQAICEHGMLQEREDLDDMTSNGLKEGELESFSIQGLIPPETTDSQTNVVVQGQALPTTEGTSQRMATIKMNGKAFWVRVFWRELTSTQKDKDTCLHTAIDNNRNDYASYLLEKMHVMNEHKHILLHKNQSGLTPLHLAVNQTYCNSERVELVKQMILLCPEALAMQSAALPSTAQDQTTEVVPKNYAPYKYFVESKDLAKGTPIMVPVSSKIGRKSATTRVPQEKKPNLSQSKELNNPHAIEEMRRLLRLACMQYHGRNRETITNLIGKPGEIHLDLTSREEVTPQFFKYMDTKTFEPILQHVYIPNLRVVDVKPDDPELLKETWWKGPSRKDCFYIFCWLRKSRCVERILSVTVDDDPVDFHSDEIIEEAVSKFDIEKWNWVKPDMCSDTIYYAAKNVRDLTLYWSGNRAVLKSWAAPDGLAKLEKTKESPARYTKLKNDFISKLKESWEDKHKCTAVPIPVFEDISARDQPTKKLSDKEMEERDLKQKWITSMDDFVQTLISYLNNRKDKGLDKTEEIKLAIIDDGVYPDRDDIGDHIPTDGSEFFNDGDDRSQWPAPYQSTYGHGHLMACLIKRICPKVRLYIAKLDESWREGRSQITTESAAKAIEWATAKDVDIISMGWTIETPAESTKLRLEKAVKTALDVKNILLFCASDDQGNLNNMPYPARFDKRIFWIGPATALGKPADNAQEGAMFLAPGQEGETAHPNARKPRLGSSIATARCAGLAALILQCILLSPDGYQRSQVRKETYVRNMFIRMSKGQNTKYRYLRVWEVFDSAKHVEMDDKEAKAIKLIADTFLKDVDELRISGR